MGKILVIFSILLSIGAAGVGYMNKSKLDETAQRATKAEGDIAKAKTELSKAQGDLKTAQQEAASAASEKETVATQLAGIQQELETSKSQLGQVNTEKTALQTQNSELTAQLQEARDVAQQSPTAATGGPAAGGDVASALAEKDALISKLQQDVDSARSQASTLMKEKQDRVQLKMRNNLQGRILAVNPAWNFVVLSLGDKNGVVTNSELLVKRGNQLVGKVRVTSVDPSTSIADIVPSSVPSGVSISPGDNVIYQVVGE